jgi:hypothetical protein
MRSHTHTRALSLSPHSHSLSLSHTHTHTHTILRIFPFILLADLLFEIWHSCLRYILWVRRYVEHDTPLSQVGRLWQQHKCQWGRVRIFFSFRSYFLCCQIIFEADCSFFMVFFRSKLNAIVGMWNIYDTKCCNGIRQHQSISCYSWVQQIPFQGEAAKNNFSSF